MVHADEDALDPREEEHHDLPLALVTHHLEGDGDVAKIGHSVSHREQVSFIKLLLHKLV